MKNRIHGATLQALDVFDAEAGRAVPILSRVEDGFSGFGRVYLSTGDAGAVKGWHYHNVQTEYFAVVRGAVTLVLYDGRKDSPTCGAVNEFALNGNEPARVEIQPGVVHGIRTDSEEESLAVICASEPYNSANPDKVRVDAKDVPYEWIALPKQPQINTDEHRSTFIDVDQITESIIGCAIKISNALGTGFLEKVYENALALELDNAGLKTEQQKRIAVTYREAIVGDYAADLVVENRVLLELKVSKAIDSAHQAQLLNYLKATGLSVGLILNFGTSRLGVKRMVL